MKPYSATLRSSCHMIAPYSLRSFVLSYDEKPCSLRSSVGRQE
jgi:hypothetical protein